MAKPKSGDTYTYDGDGTLGIGDGAIAPGTKVRVREVVAAKTIGAHNDSEESVVVETKDGRAWSVGLELLDLDYKRS